jgi:photosystem II stability/assembly factor-like uncharacterized protein
MHRTPRLAHRLVAIGLCLSTYAPELRANGAFPDSAQILLPLDEPAKITIGTNFGLISSDDGGSSWHWVCETENTNYGRLYQLGRAGRVLGISSLGLVMSDDGACSWQLATGIAEQATDAFVDPSKPERVFAIAGPLAVANQVYASTDGGSSFTPLGLSLGPDRYLSSVEAAIADSNRIYVTSQSTADLLDAALEVSEDGGATWETRALPPDLVGSLTRIVRVDPEDADRIFLRVSPPVDREVLAISSDGGRSFSTPMPPVGVLGGFLRRSDGTLIVSALEGGLGQAFMSYDGGATFESMPLPLRLRALAERDGVIYGAADNQLDGVALAKSLDGGMTWQSVLAYSDVREVKACAFSECESSCNMQAEVWALWPTEVCLPPGTPRGGDDEQEPKDAACGCRLRPSSDAGSCVFALALVSCWLGRRRGRRR